MNKLYFKDHFFYVRCCAHVFNILVQDGLQEVESIIVKVRETVKYLKKSPSRLTKFGDVARHKSILTKKGLCLDVPTGWNSTFLMLESTFAYRDAFSYYAGLDAN